MKLSWIYIIKCSDNTYYTGVTSNLDGRMEKHHSGYYPNCYTAKRRPLELAFYAEFTDINIAIEKEKQIKNWSNGKKEALINGDFDKLQWLSECRNSRHHKYDPNKKEELD